MNDGKDRAGRVGAQLGEQIRVGVGDHRLDARLGQGVADPLT